MADGLKPVRARRPTDWQEVIGTQSGDTRNPIACMASVCGLLGDIEGSARKNEREKLEFALAEMGYMILVAASRSCVYMSAALALKFPGMCIRCKRTGRCMCKQDVRYPPPPKLVGVPRPDLLALPLGRWQGQLRKHYGKLNIMQGFDRVLIRLMAEIGEAMQEIAKHGDVQHADHYPLYNEFADVFAWWVGLVTLLELNAEHLLHMAYQRHSRAA